MSKDEMEKGIDPRTLTVPEEVLNLGAKLKTNTHFQTLRATLGEPVINVILSSLEGTQSVSEFDRKFAEWWGSLQVVATQIAREHFAGHTEAEEQFIEAMEQEHCLLDGEQFDDTTSSSFTLFMFEPEKTLLLMEAVARIDNHVVYYPARERPGFLTKLGSAQYETQYHADLGERLLNAFPSLDNIMFQTSSCFPHYKRPFWHDALLAAYAHDVLSRYPDQRDVRGLAQQHNGTYVGDNRRALAILQRWYPNAWKTQSWRFRCALAFLAYGTAQDYNFGDVKVAKWQFRLPNIISGVEGGIGLYPAEHHEAWTNLKPALVSNNVVAGMGALRLTYRESKYFPDSPQVTMDPDSPLRFHLA
jgi:hypothetical protein